MWRRLYNLVDMLGCRAVALTITEQIVYNIYKIYKLSYAHKPCIKI